MLLAATIAVPQASATAKTIAKTTAKTASRPTPAIPSGEFLSVLQNGWTGRCADLANYGSVPPNTPVTQFDCDFSITGDNQVWNFEPVSTVQGVTFYKIVNGKSGLCLDLPNYGSNPPGTPVSVYACAANQSLDNQEWFFEYVETTYGQAYYQIVNADSELCLDVANSAADNSDLANGLPLSIYTCYDSHWANSGYDDHLWAFAGYTS